jgi:hypothetical protein
MGNNLLDLLACCELILATNPNATQIPITPLLELFDTLKNIVSALGMLFSFAADDIKTKCGQIKGLCTKYGLLQTTVNALIVCEKEKLVFQTGATRTLLPLIRSLEFVTLMLNSLAITNNELGECLRESYYATLYHRHNYAMAGIVVAASYSAPIKKNFFLVLGIENNVGIELCKLVSPKLDLIYKGLKALYEEERVWEMK